MFRCTLALLAFLTACSSVQVAEPIGTAPDPLEAEAWDGHWFAANGVLRFDVERTADDRLNIASFERSADRLEWQAEDSGPAIVRKIKLDIGSERRAFHLVHLTETSHQSAGPYGFFLVSILPGQIVAWLPNISYFADLVDRDVLAGEVERSGGVTHVKLATLTDEQLEAHIGSQGQVAFAWHEPIAFVRMPESLLSPVALKAPKAEGEE